MDLAQAQEVYFLDQRAYATNLGNGAGLLNRSIPATVSAHYTLTLPFNVNNAAFPPTFTLVLTPIATDKTIGAASSNPDGTLVINNLQQRWRELDGNLTYGATDCTWEAGNCTPH
jgi:hypothetical protein